MSEHREPDTDHTLWRYMDFAKYVSLLSSSSLYCCSAALFSDPYEGAIGLLEHKDKFINKHREAFKFITDYFNSLDRDEVDELMRPVRIKYLSYHDEFTDEEYIEHLTETLVKQKEIESDFARKSTFINCWYQSEFESLGMWQLYSRDNQNAVAIKTKFSRLSNALRGDINADIGNVTYIDYENPPAEFINKVQLGKVDRFWYKSHHFAHEKEVRIIPEYSVQDSSNIPSGILLPIDLTTLIEKVHVSPSSQPWLILLVKEVSEKYGLNVEVVESTIAKKPYY